MLSIATASFVMAQSSPIVLPSKSSFSSLLSLSDAPQQLLRRDAYAHALCRSILKSVYSNHSHASTPVNPPLGPLFRVHVSSDFAHDQLWQQLDLRNKPLLKYLKQTVSSPPAKRRRVSKPLRDRFFNEEHMNDFVQQAEHDALNLQSLEADADHNENVHDDDDDSDHNNDADVAAKRSGGNHARPERYSDFFDDAPSDSISAADSVPTPLQLLRQKHQSAVQAVEQAIIQPKAWPLRGEVSAFARPKDSLLETSVHHDVAVRPTSFVSTEVSQAIEDVVKQRIVDGLFDEVIPAPPQHYDAKNANTSKRAKLYLPDVSQEKPSEGLADLYAREFTEQRDEQLQVATASATVQSEGEEKLTEAQIEVNNLFDKLSSRLDALTSLHFVHNRADTTADTLVSKANIKSIAAEEPVPEGVSDGDMLAAREVFVPDKRQLKGPTEMTKQERKAKRRSNKNRAAKKSMQTAANSKSATHFDAVAVDQRKADVALDRSRQDH